MKEFLEFIEIKKQEFVQLPLFKFMQDKSIHPRQRLVFSCCLAPFIMSFGELNKHIFREELTSDRVQKLINKHTYEDDHHWIWFLEDLEKLGFDEKLKFTEALRFLWSEETRISRQVANELYRYTFQASPIQKLAVIEAAEATGNAFLEVSSQVARELSAITHQEYRYFGSSHLVVDTGHTFCTSEGRRFIENIQLSPKEREDIFEIAEKIFAVFTDLMSELMTYAKLHQVKHLSIVAKSESTRSFFTAKNHSPSINPPIPKNSKNTKPLGSYLVEAGLITSEQLELALREQKKTVLPIGQVLSHQGWINQQTIEYMMEKVVLPERDLALKQ